MRSVIVLLNISKLEVCPSKKSVYFVSKISKIDLILFVLEATSVSLAVFIDLIKWSITFAYKFEVGYQSVIPLSEQEEGSIQYCKVSEPLRVLQECLY